MYMLDTDTCSYVLKTKSRSLGEKFESHSESIAISEVVLAELRYGADKHQNRTQEIHELINTFITHLDVVPWAASAEYGKLLADLERAGTPIGNLDTLIAAHAICLDCVLVTNNLQHFSRVPDLTLENWV